MKVSLKAGVFGTLLTAFLVLLPTGAQAAGIELPGRPSADHDYGIAFASMPAACTSPGSGEFGTTGGWSARSGVIRGRIMDTAPADAIIRPAVIRLTEPCVASGVIRLGVETYAFGATPPTGYHSALNTNGCAVNNITGPPVCNPNHSMSATQGDIYALAQFRVTCSNTQWSLPGQQYYRNPTSVPNSATQFPPDTGGWTSTPTNAAIQGVTASNCPYIVAIRAPLVADVERNSLVTLRVENMTIDLRVWNADAYASQSNPYPDRSEAEAMCSKLSEAEKQYWPTCEPYVVTPEPEVDYADFDTVCAGAPAFAWGDFSWLPALIGHYAACLWQPQGGFDPEGLIAAQFEESGYKTIATTVDNAVAAFSTTGGCGPLPAVPIAGQVFAFDTCTMSWANPFRDILGIGIAAGTGFYVLGVVVDVLVSLHQKKLKSPVSADA